MNSVARYASLVKFAHTIFAMPFALIGFTYGLVSTGTPFDWVLLLKILLCMVFARNSAMGFNRLTDRKIDAVNPRTASREIPSGVISPRQAAWFVALNCAAFVVTAGFINKLTLILAPVALAIILGYSYTKRFTSLAHLVLGLSLAIAPAGAYIAVAGTITLVPLVLAALVVTWTGGFDIIYSLQDAEFDREHNLHSIPARFGIRGAIGISIALHVVSAAAVAWLGVLIPGNMFYWIGAALFCVVLTVQHLLATPSRISKIGASFTMINGIASVTYAVFTITDILVR